MTVGERLVIADLPAVVSRGGQCIAPRPPIDALRASSSDGGNEKLPNRGQITAYRRPTKTDQWWTGDRPTLTSTGAHPSQTARATRARALVAQVSGRLTTVASQKTKQCLRHRADMGLANGEAAWGEAVTRGPGTRRREFGWRQRERGPNRSAVEKELEDCNRGGHFAARGVLVGPVQRCAFTEARDRLLVRPGLFVGPVVRPRRRGTSMSMCGCPGWPSSPRRGAEDKPRETSPRGASPVPGNEDRSRPRSVGPRVATALTLVVQIVTRQVTGQTRGNGRCPSRAAATVPRQPRRTQRDALAVARRLKWVRLGTPW